MSHERQKGLFTAPTPPEPTEQELAIQEGIDRAIAAERDVDQSTARGIAAWLHGEEGTAIQAFAASGEVDAEKLYEELSAEHELRFDPQARQWIVALLWHCLGPQIASSGHTANPPEDNSMC